MDCDLMLAVKEHASTVRNRTGKVRFARAMPTTNPRTGMLWERDWLAVRRPLQAHLIKTPNNLSTYNSDINVVICNFFKNISRHFPYSTISRMYNIHSVALTCLDESYSSTCIVSSGNRNVPKKN